MAPLTRTPSPGRLASKVVHAAQQWAAAALSGTTTFDPSTQEGQLLLALLDSVQDLEYHQANPARTVLDVNWFYQGTLDLTTGPGTPGA